MKARKINPRFDIDDVELLGLPEGLVAELGRPLRNRYVELRAFVFTAERLLKRLAVSVSSQQGNSK